MSELEHFQFETLHVSNHTACRLAEKTRFFRLLWAGRRRAAALRFTFFKVETLYGKLTRIRPDFPAWPASAHPLFCRAALPVPRASSDSRKRRTAWREQQAAYQHALKAE